VVRTITAGVVLAVAAAAALLVGDGFGWGLDAVLLLGVGAGAVLGLVPDGSPLAKIGGFALGLLAASIGYALRAAVFPDSTTARAVAVVLVVLAATGLVLLTFGRAPLWSAFLGVAVLGGAYEETYTESPGSLLSTLPVALTSVLAVVAVGFAATVFFSGADGEAGQPRRRRASSERPPETEPDEEVSLDEVMTAGSN
jgi:hypothetical protein